MMAEAALAPELVLDCSIALAWCYPDEPDDYADAVMDCLDDRRAIVPQLWRLEVANVMLTNERKKRFTSAQVAGWLTRLAVMPLSIDAETSARAWRETLHLARAHRLTSYDASYLELAMRLGLPLASLDMDLLKAAAAVGVARFKA